MTTSQAGLELSLETASTFISVQHIRPMRKLTYLLIATMWCLVDSNLLHADNWAHWRGPSGNGEAKNAKPPTEWSDTKNVKWKVAIEGQGSGSPVIWENQVFVVSAISAGGGSAQAQPRGQGGRFGRGGVALTKTEFKLFCFDRKTGDKAWEKTATVAVPHQGVHSTNNFASASPCTDGKHVYAFFGSRGLYCYTMEGKLVWKKEDFGKMNTRNGFGEGSSPTIAGDKIIVPWDHEGPSSLYALNKNTGDVIWKTDRDEPTNWSTPLVVEFDGKKQVVMNGQNYARSYDLESGKELWKCGGQTQRPCASAVADDELIYVGSGFRGSYLGAFKPNGQGDIGGTDKVAWSVSRDTPDIASPLLTQGRLYFHKGKSGMISCFDAKSGKQLYGANRVSGLASIYASPVAAGDYVFLTGRSGRTVVLKNSDDFEVVATNSVGEGVDATPAPVDNQLFIRGAKHLFCIENK